MSAKKSESKTEKIEKEYVIPLRRQTQKAVRYKKTPKAIKTIKEFLVRHMKIYDRNLNKIKIDKYLNEFVWFRGIKKPPAKVKVKAIKEGEIVKVELAELPEKLRFKKLREEKIEKFAEVAKEKKKSLMEKAKEGITGEEKKPEEKTEEDVKAEKEKTKAGEEELKKLEKAKAKEMKHLAGGKEKQPKRQIRKALEK